MQHLDRSRPFGAISPPLVEPDLDRPAFYEQDGKLFDAHDRHIEPGKPLPEDEEPPVNDSVKDTAAGMSPAVLLANAGAMPWAAFRKRAREILGDACPAGKSDIVEALKAAIQHYEARQKRRTSGPNTSGPKVAEPDQKSTGLTWNNLTGQEENENLTAKPVAKAGEIDLAAWGRGQKEYIFSEVRKGIRAKFSVSVTERRDAVNLLVDEKVITAAEARKDIV